MENASYHASRQPLVPGVQPQPVYPGQWRGPNGQELPTGAQLFGGQLSQPSPEQNSVQRQNKIIHRRIQPASTGEPRHHHGQRTIKVTSAPAAILKLLDTVMSGGPMGICKAPLNCRTLLLEAPRVLDRHESMSCMIPTPTGSATLDTMPSTPLDDLAGGLQGVIWPPLSAAEAAKYAPGGNHMASIYCSNRNEAAVMPVLRLSEVLPSQLLVEPNVSNMTASVSGQASQMESIVNIKATSKAQLGSPELPSRGSALHAWRACKPCAFFFQDGCANKEECEFCHLCEPGERKRRKKDRKVQKREAAEQRVMQGVPQIWNAQR